FSCKSDRYRHEIIRDAIDLEDALVCRFVNANTDEKRIAFLSRFGLPTQAFPSEPRNFILGEQRLLRRLLERACSGDSGQAIKAANESLRHGHAGAGLTLSLDPQGRLVHTWESPMSFMHMEIAVAARIGARLGSCKRCHNLFLYGRGTKR